MPGRLQLLPVRPRVKVLTITRSSTASRDFRFIGLVLIAIAVSLLVFVDYDIVIEPMLPLSFILLAILGVVVVTRSPQKQQTDRLLEVDLSRGLLTLGQRVTNGSGETQREVDIAEVDEVLFAMKDAPVDLNKPNSPKVDAFTIAIRLFDGEVIVIVETCYDQDLSFRVARSLANMMSVGVKQVGKGWRSA